MTVLVLTLALFTQTTPTVEQVDLYFTASQEHFVWQIAPKTEPPKHIKELFIELSCSDWVTREEASKKLYKLCSSDRREERWLFWGRQNPDWEVAYRCDAIISRLHPCDSCHGSGESKFYGECWQCKGVRTFWGMHRWAE